MPPPLDDRKNSTSISGHALAQPVPPGHTAPQIPGYEIRGILGRGERSVVYAARDLEKNRPVALKVLDRSLFSADEVGRLRSEAATIARLQHPHVVQVYEVGETADQLFIAEELVEGPTLATRLCESPLPPRTAAELIEKLARALEAVHWQEVLHRDLKPSHVLLTEEGSPKIADFGLAKRRAVSGWTYNCLVEGTPSYMPPEQAEGRSDLGPAADLYALGAVLYEALTGRPPYWAPTELETLQQLCALEPVWPRALQPTIPTDLETVCLKCLRKQPARRYGSARELADDLQRYLEGRPILARPLPLWERTVKLVRRHPAWVSLATVAAFGILLFVAVLLKSSREQNARYGHALEAAEALNQQIADVVRPLAASGSPRIVETLRSASIVYDRLLAENPTAHALAGKARMLNTFADLYLELNHSLQAQQAADAALAIHQQLVEQEPRLLAYHVGLAESYERRGDALRLRETLAEALMDYENSAKIRRNLVERRSSDRELRYELARAVARTAVIYRLEGNLPKAGAALEEVFLLASQAGGRQSDPPERRRHLASCHEQQGDLLFDYANSNATLDDVIGQYRAALAIYEELTKLDPANSEWQRDVARVMTSIGKALASQERRGAAQSELARAVEMAQIEVERNPAHRRWRKELLRARIALAEIENAQAPSLAGYERQIALHQEMLALLHALSAEDPENREWSSRQAKNFARLAQLRLKAAELDDSSDRHWKAALDAAEQALKRTEPLIEHDPDYRPARIPAIFADHWAATALVKLMRSDDAALHWKAALSSLVGLQERGRLAPSEIDLIGQIQSQLDRVENAPK